MLTCSNIMPDRIILDMNGSLIFFNSYEIIFLKAEGNYTEIHLVDGQKKVLCKTLKEVASSFKNNHFFYRIHNSYFININHIKEYQKSYGGRLIMSNEKSVNISRAKKEDFLAKLLI